MESFQCPDQAARGYGVSFRSSSPINPLLSCQRLQHQLRQHGDAIANSIVLEQGKTFAGMSTTTILQDFM